MAEKIFDANEKSIPTTFPRYGHLSDASALCPRAAFEDSIRWWFTNRQASGIAMQHPNKLERPVKRPSNSAPRPSPLNPLDAFLHVPAVLNRRQAAADRRDHMIRGMSRLSPHSHQAPWRPMDRQRCVIWLRSRALTFAPPGHQGGIPAPPRLQDPIREMYSRRSSCGL